MLTTLSLIQKRLDVLLPLKSRILMMEMKKMVSQESVQMAIPYPLPNAC